jgi:hypothetical protein
MKSMLENQRGGPTRTGIYRYSQAISAGVGEMTPIDPVAEPLNNPKPMENPI